MKQVIVTIDINGSVQIDAQGYKGIGCEKATQFLENALGTQLKHKRKPEYYQQIKQQQRLQQ